MKWITTFLLIAMHPLSADSVPPLSTAQQVRDHWAFKPVSNPVPPKIDSDWARNPVDQFVLRRLTEAGMETSKRADRCWLLRITVNAGRGIGWMWRDTRIRAATGLAVAIESMPMPTPTAIM
jgi:hypothetical protein